MFVGVYTAIVTPFDTAGRLDLPRLEAHVRRQVEAGVDGLVPVGTTGESPTLNFEEHIEVIRRTVEAAAGEVKVIAGTGANATEEALQLTRAAREVGADASLQVTPYYNKPNDAGLIRHFTEVADLGLPVVLYNIPGRCVKSLSIELLAELAQHPNIVAVKEAGGSVDRVSRIRAACALDILSGDDPLTLPMMAVGARGVISVASNVIPDQVIDLVRFALDGNFIAAREVHERNISLFHTLLGLDTNPIPVKTALALMGHIEEVFRLPLHPLSPADRDRLEALLGETGLR